LAPRELGTTRNLVPGFNGQKLLQFIQRTFLVPFQVMQRRFLHGNGENLAILVENRVAFND